MIAVDLDGVVVDSEPYLVKGLENFTKTVFNPPKPRTYDFRDGFVDLKLEDCLNIIDKTLVEYVTEIPVLHEKETYLALALVQKYFGHVLFLTARNPKIKTYTDLWLKNKFGGLRYELYHVGHNGNKEKWLTKHNISVIIEDRLRTVNSFSINIKPYLVEQEWNKGRYTKGSVVRVPTLLEAVEDILTWV